MSVFGDQSLRLLHLETYLQTWPDIPYGALISVGLMLALFVQVIVTNGLLILAGRIAARPGWE